MNKVVKSTLALMLVSILVKILGFVRELVLASSYGTSIYSDAYLTAINIPLVIFTLVGSAIGTTFIPIFLDIEKENGIKESIRFTNNIMNLVCLICIILLVLGMIFTKYLVKIFAVGFEGEILDITINFTRIILSSILFIGISNIMTAFLHSKDNFIVPGIISLPRNIITICSIIISSKYGVYCMIWGTLLGIISECLLQIPFLYKKQYKYKLYINIKEKYMKKVIYLAIPVFIGIAVNQVNAIIDRTLASTLSEGSISALNYANRLNQFIMTIFITSIASVIYPLLSKQSKQNNKDNFKKSIIKIMNLVVIILVPITIGAIVLANPIVKLLFERGAFNHTATQMTSTALIFYSVGLVSFGLRDILNKIFYSIQDTKTPMINGCIAVILNILLNIILVRYMGHSGLALATSISSIIGILLLFISLDKKIGYFGQKIIIRTAFLSIISSVCMAIVVYFIYFVMLSGIQNILVGDFISIVISILAGIIVYIVMLFILRVDETKLIINIIEGMLKNLNRKDKKIFYEESGTL